MTDNLTTMISGLRVFLHEKEEFLSTKGALTSDRISIKLFYKRIDELVDSAKEIRTNYADNENILFNFNKRVLEIQREIEELEP